MIRSPTPPCVSHPFYSQLSTSPSTCKYPILVTSTVEFLTVRSCSIGNDLSGRRPCIQQRTSPIHTPGPHGLKIDDRRDGIGRTKAERDSGSGWATGAFRECPRCVCRYPQDDMLSFLNASFTIIDLFSSRLELVNVDYASGASFNVLFLINDPVSRLVHDLRRDIQYVFFIY